MNADADDREVLRAQQLKEEIRRRMKNWPPLTPAQRDRIAVLLAPDVVRQDR